MNGYALNGSSVFLIVCALPASRASQACRALWFFWGWSLDLLADHQATLDAAIGNCLIPKILHCQNNGGNTANYGRCGTGHEYPRPWFRSEEHTSELPSLMRISYDVFSLKKKKHTN